MAQLTASRHSPPATLGEIAAWTKAELVDPSRADLVIRGIASLDEADPMQLAFCESPKYSDQLAKTNAGACLVNKRSEGSVPSHVAVLRTANPFYDFVKIAREWHKDVLRPKSQFGETGISPSALIHPSAKLGDEVIVDPFAVVGMNAQVGTGTVIGPGAVIGPNVTIGRDCNVGANSSVQFAHIGDNVLIHSGCQIGQDGFGFIPQAGGALKIPQMSQVIIQRDVEIGSGTAIDRGSIRDTVIGEGTKIDNLVQIGHNVVIGRHCLIAAQVAIGGSATVGDRVMLGAGVGLNNHIFVGDGAQITAMSGVKDSVPANARWGGFFAKPTKRWFREILAVERLADHGSITIPRGNLKQDEGQD
jgi:UDP-3-O-[3-hydroxymyristoyl] glucosamine N-acyltransferase